MRAMRGLVSLIGGRAEQHQHQQQQEVGGGGGRGGAPPPRGARGFSLLRGRRGRRTDAGADHREGPVVGPGAELSSDDDGGGEEGSSRLRDSSGSSWTTDLLARKHDLAGTSAARAGGATMEVEEEVVGEECCICLEELGEAVRYQGKMDCCEHVVCWTCIQEWAAKSRHCPICQRTFRKFKRTKPKPPPRRPKGRRQTLASCETSEANGYKMHKKERSLWERMPWRRRRLATHSRTEPPPRPWDHDVDAVDEVAEEVIVVGPMRDSQDDGDVSARQRPEDIMNQAGDSSGNEDGEAIDGNSNRTSAPDDGESQEEESNADNARGSIEAEYSSSQADEAQPGTAVLDNVLDERSASADGDESENDARVDTNVSGSLRELKADAVSEAEEEREKEEEARQESEYHVDEIDSKGKERVEAELTREDQEEEAEEKEAKTDSLRSDTDREEDDIEQEPTTPVRTGIVPFPLPEENSTSQEP